MLFISQLFIYPIKSLGGIAVNEAEVTSRGLKYDRRYMLVDNNNTFITQRDFSAMALLRTAIESNKLVVYHINDLFNKLFLPLNPSSPDAFTVVRIWDDSCEAQYVSEEADKWFSNKLNFQCRLVYMPESTKRNVDPQFAINNDITSFSDGYPLLLVGQASLDDLNSRLGEPVPINRFRPNIVMRGGFPFQEDKMEQFSINGIMFYGVKPCSRCVVTATNQETAIKDKEPLRTLARYRLYNNKPLFGQNVLCNGAGVIKTGDEIIIMA
jgi:uncharacterized protein YcbX